MIINRLIKILLILLGVAFIVLEVIKYDFYGDAITAMMLILLTILYMRSEKNKEKLFILFLTTYAISEVLVVITNYLPLEYLDGGFAYYISNSLYMLSYFFLILLSVKSMKLKEIVSKFSVILFVLLALGIFCVTLITETAQAKLTTAEYITEFMYNTVVMCLLATSLLFYMYKEDNKSIVFFIGSMLIFFSEMIQFAYYYIAEMEHLAAIYSVFLVLAFAFYYRQSQLEHVHEESLSSHHLKV